MPTSVKRLAQVRKRTETNQPARPNPRNQGEKVGNVVISSFFKMKI